MITLPELDRFDPAPFFLRILQLFIDNLHDANYWPAPPPLADPAWAAFGATDWVAGELTLENAPRRGVGVVVIRAR